MKTLFTTLMLVLGFISIALSQGTEQPKTNVNYKKYPYWIKMMDDPNVNYFEAVKAFEEFWKDREGPEIEEEENHGKKERSFLKKIFKSEKKEKLESQQYVIQYKRFKQWKRDAEPYVQSDGRILSKEEQMEIWKNSRK